MNTVEQRVKQVVIEQTNVSEDAVTSDTSFIYDLGADSLDAAELVMALEDEFECEIPDEDVARITTVQEAIDYVRTRLGP